MNNKTVSASGKRLPWRSIATSLAFLLALGVVRYATRPRTPPVPKLDHPSFYDAARSVTSPVPGSPVQPLNQAPTLPDATPAAGNSSGSSAHLRPSPWTTPTPGSPSSPRDLPVLTKISDQGLAKLLQSLDQLNAKNSRGVTWREYDNFYGRVFPCLAIAQGSQNENPEARPEGVLGDYPNSPYVATVTAPREGALLRMELRCDEMMKPSVVETRAPAAGPFGLIAKVRWDLEALEKNRQSRQVQLTWSLSVDGGPAETRTHSITLEPIDVAPLSYLVPSGETLLLFPIFAAYVNEDHPSLDGILREALETQVVSRFTGMPKVNNPDAVRQQVLAIWWALQRRGIVYSTVASTSTANDEVLSAQRVRLLDDIVDAKQANCIDGTVLLASLLKRIGLFPLLCVMEGHAFLGYHTVNERDLEEVDYLETVFLNNRNAYLRAQEEIAAAGETPTEDPSTASREPGTQTCPANLRDARAMFRVALEFARTEAEEAREAAERDNEKYFYLIDVESVRRTRSIRPIPSLKR